MLCCVRDLKSLLVTEGKRGKQERLHFSLGLSRSHREVAAEKTLYEQQENSLFQLELGAHFKSNYLLGVNCLEAWSEWWFEIPVFKYLSSSPGASLEKKTSCKKCAPLRETFFLHRESGLKTPRNVHLLSKGDSYTCSLSQGSALIHSTVVSVTGQIPNKVPY